MNTALPQRFWAKVQKTDTCWLWTAATTSRGYGSFGYQGRRQSPHRLIYVDQVGPIPVGLTIDHLCRVKACVNPAHLEAVTSAENVRRHHRLTTHCPAGHPYDEANTVRSSHGTRNCRECRNARHRLHPAGLGHLIGAQKRWGKSAPPQRLSA